MTIPTNAMILTLLDGLEHGVAEDLESEFLDFKPWGDLKATKKIALEYAVCFANAGGGVVVFGVADGTKGRTAAIHGARRYRLDEWRRDLYVSIRPNLSVEVEELEVQEGTGRILIVRVPRGPNPPYGTAEGLYKRRVGKNCMPLDPHAVAKVRISTGAVDWSGEPTENADLSEIDLVEVERARNMLRARNPESPLLRLKDRPFLEGLKAIVDGRVTHTGLLLFGRDSVIEKACPQSQVHYVYQSSRTRVSRNDIHRGPLLRTLEQIEGVFMGPVNPEEELQLGFGKTRIPAFPLEVVREAVLNAVTHRDYTEPGEVLIRHMPKELVITSPGGFVGGITLSNILRHEPKARNRTLANALVSLRLVESAGVGRGLIFETLLSYGKRSPKYETDGTQVTLRIFDGEFDRRMAALIAKWRKEGREIDLDGLLILSRLKGDAFIDTRGAAELLQLSSDAARGVLDLLAQPRRGILERRGRTRGATYHLAKGVAKDLLGKAAYTKTKGLNPIRYEEMVRTFVSDHGSITPQECRELLGLGESQTARVEVSRLLRRWTTRGGFLRREGNPPKVRYFPRGASAPGVSG